jgi:hypothetical protein
MGRRGLKSASRHTFFLRGIAFALMLIVSFGSSTVQSVEIKRINANINSRITVEIYGTVQKGDLGKIREYFSLLPTHDNKRIFVYLNSNGGDPLEGIAIGRFFREKGAFTLVGVGSKCISACFFMFLGGYDIESKQIARFKAVQGALGVHRTSLNIADGSYTQDQLGDTIQSHQLLILEIVEYFEEVEVSNKLLMALLKTPSETTYYIDNREAQENQIHVEDCDAYSFKTIDCRLVRSGASEKNLK